MLIGLRSYSSFRQSFPKEYLAQSLTDLLPQRNPRLLPHSLQATIKLLAHIPILRRSRNIHTSRNSSSLSPSLCIKCPLRTKSAWISCFLDNTLIFCASCSTCTSKPRAYSRFYSIAQLAPSPFIEKTAKGSYRAHLHPLSIALRTGRRIWTQDNFL